MNRNYLVCALLVSATVSVSTSAAVPTISMAKLKSTLQGAWQGTCGYGKAVPQWMLNHKVVTLVAAAVVAGGVVLYVSDELRAKVYELLGLNDKEVKKVGVVRRRAVSDEEELKQLKVVLAVPGGETPSNVNRLCSCEVEEDISGGCEIKEGACQTKKVVWKRNVAVKKDNK